MKRYEVVDIFAKNGWNQKKDEVGDFLTERRIGSKILWSIIYNNSYSVRLGMCIDSESYRKISTIIRNPRKRYAEESIICIRDFTFSKDVPESYDECDVRELITQCEAWACDVDLDKHLDILCNIPTDSIGDYPLRHLAALATVGDVERLHFYKISFAKGDRLGFVPYIDNGFIDRAFEQAKLRNANPHWIPERPLIRI